MNIRRLELLAMSALLMFVAVLLPPWRHVTHVVHETSCKVMTQSAFVCVDYAPIAMELRGLPRLIISILILAFLVSLLLKCCKKTCSQKEMYSCAICSTPYQPGSKYCHSCGAGL